MAALGGCPLFSLVTVLVYLLSHLSSSRRTRASRSDLEPEPWRWCLGLLFHGEVLLLGVLLGGLVEIALMSSSKKCYVSVCVFNKTKVFTLASMHIPAAIAKGAGGRSAA